ncbi:unnamed protein product, partial [Urochloa humidicola]
FCLRPSGAEREGARLGIGMAAMRSALAMVSRRCSDSPVAASVSGRGLELYQVFRPPPLPLRPAAVHEAGKVFRLRV